jgi:hypothetical protein
MENNFSEKLNGLTNDELVKAFNDQVGNQGWTSSRGKYLTVLHVLISRGIDMSAVSTESSTSYKHKVKLEGMKLVPIVDNESNVQAVLDAWENSSISARYLDELSALSVNELLSLLKGDMLEVKDVQDFKELLSNEDFYVLLELLHKANGEYQIKSPEELLIANELESHRPFLRQAEVVNKLIFGIE